MTILEDRLAELRKKIAAETGKLHSNIELMRMGVNRLLEAPPKSPYPPELSNIPTPEETSLLSQQAAQLAAFLETEDGQDLRCLFVDSFKKYLNPEVPDEEQSPDNTESDAGTQE